MLNELESDAQLPYFVYDHQIYAGIDIIHT